MYVINEHILKSDDNIPIKAHLNSSDIDIISADSHFHGEIELVYLLEGSLKYSAEGEEFTAKKGDLVIFNSMTEHSAKETDFVRIILLQFKTNLLSDFCNKHWDYFESFFSNDFKYILVDTNEKTQFSPVPELLLSIVEEINTKNTAYEFSIISNLLKIFTIIFRNVKFESQYNTSITPVANDIIQYINDNFDCDLKLNEVAENFHFSSSYFSHIFKEITGTSFVKYLNNYRINISKKLLMNPKNTITGAMVQVGITNRSYYNRLFKRNTGYTPQEFRNKFFKSQNR